MSNSAAARRKEQADIIKKLQDERKALSAQKRRQTSGTGPVSYGVVSTNIAGFGGFNPNINIDTGKLDVGGGVMMGPIAYNPQQKTISSGTLTISGLLNQSSSWIICLGEGAAADDLVTIAGASFSGQILYLQAQNNDITIKHNTGNIFTHDGNDVVLSGYNSGTNTGGEVAILIFDNQVVDTSSGKWVVVATHGGTAASSWVGTATSNLDMNTYDIEGVDRLKFSAGASSSDALLSTDYGIEIEGASASPSGLKYNVPSSKTHKFYVNAGSAKMTVSSTNISFNEDLFMNSNGIYLDNDQDTYFVSTSDDNISIATGGSTRLSISDFGLYMYSDIVMNSFDIDLNGNELTIDADGDSYIQAVSDDTIQVVTSGTLRLQVDNSLVFANQDIGIISGSKLKGFFGVIGLQVSSSSLTVGSAGSLQVPYLSSTTTYSTGVNSTLDGIFGNLDGCMGIQYNSTSPTYTVWYRLNGGWRRNFLT